MCVCVCVCVYVYVYIQIRSSTQTHPSLTKNSHVLGLQSTPFFYCNANALSLIYNKKTDPVDYFCLLCKHARLVHRSNADSPCCN